MKHYEKLKIELIVGQWDDVLTATSGYYESVSDVNTWFGTFEEGGGEA